MTYNIIKLTFQGPIHLSKGKSDYLSGNDILHSDTLKSALFAAAVQSGLDIAADEAGNPFLDSFVVSSAFPYYEDEYFFPKPMCLIPNVYDQDEKLVKKAEKPIRFIGKSIFEEIVNQRNVDKDNSGAMRFSKKISFQKETWHNGKFASASIHAKAASNPYFYIMEQDSMLRVTVPRVGSEDPAPYHVERTFFPPEGGLYFFVQWHHENYKKQFEQALDTLGENGIGTDRNTGNGQFSWTASILELDTPETGTHQVLLSLYCPKDATEIPDNVLADSAFTIIKRGGYISSPADEKRLLSYRKNAVYMFTEGSLLAQSGSHLSGILHDLKPELVVHPVQHPIWRDGRPFALPSKPIL